MKRAMSIAAAVLFFPWRYIQHIRATYADIRIARKKLALMDTYLEGIPVAEHRSHLKMATRYADAEMKRDLAVTP